MLRWREVGGGGEVARGWQEGGVLQSGVRSEKGGVWGVEVGRKWPRHVPRVTLFHDGFLSPVAIFRLIRGLGLFFIITIV